MSKHVVTRPRDPFVSGDGAIEVHQVPASKDNLIWLIVCRQTGTAAAVDGPEAGPLLSYCEGRGIELSVILNTHTHPDHIGINRDLQKRSLLAGMRVFGPQRAAAAVPGITDPMNDGDTVQIDAVRGKVMLTEGHIDGHISYVFDDIVFCGDTLFAGGCGFLFDGPAAKMHDSLCRLAALDGRTRVCCAHEYTQDNLRFAWSVEPDNQALAERIRRVWAVRAQGGCAVPSLMEEELATNPFLRADSPTVQAAVQRAMPGVDMSTPVAAFAAVRALKDRKDYRRIPDAELPLA